MTIKRKLPIVLLATTVSSFTTPFMGFTLPIIARDFSLNALSLSWVDSSFLLVTNITLVPRGRLVDLYGRKIFFLSGSLIFALSSFFYIRSETESFLITMLVFAWMIDNRIITHRNGTLLLGSTKLIFGILVVTCVFGVFVSLARGRIHK